MQEYFLFKSMCDTNYVSMESIVAHTVQVLPSLVPRFSPSPLSFLPTEIRGGGGESLVANGHVHVLPGRGYQLATPHLSMARAMAMLRLYYLRWP